MIFDLSVRPIEESQMHVTPVQVRRRTRAMRVAVPTLLAAAVLTPNFLLGVWFATGRPAAAAAAAGLLVVLAAGRVLVSGPAALVRRALAGRPALDDLLPAEVWAQLFVLPVATVAVSALSSAALTMGSLTIGEDPVLPAGWRAYALLVLLLSATIAVIVPVGAAYRAVRQRAEQEVRIFDDTVADARHTAAMRDQWRALRSHPRWWLADRRVAALGTLSAEPLRAWPTRWRSTGGSVMLAPVTVLSCLSVAAVVGLLAALVAGLPGGVRLAGGEVFLLALPALAVGVDVYRLLLVEQSRADVLRAAHARRQELKVQRRASELAGGGAPPARAIDLSSLPRRDLLSALFARRAQP